jgi:uncharacterized membrane protein YjgN (DUF898 family)
MLVFLIVPVVIQAVFTILFLRIIVPKLSIGGKAFVFRGHIAKYLGMNLTGLLLSIVTLTVYLPWYARRIVTYLVGETTFNGSSPEFLGKAGRLLKYLLLAMWIPVIVVGIVFGLMSGVGTVSYATVQAGMTPAQAGMAFAVSLIMIPFLYLMYKWYVDVRWNDVTIAWRTSLWPSCGFILGQLLLSLITISIYWPAAALRLYRYFTARTVLSKRDVEMGRLGFDGSIAKGWRLMWGQALLSIVTLGAYIPWACAIIGRWIAASTYYEESAPGA